MNPKRKSTNWWFVHRNFTDSQLERLKIPHHDVKYLIFRIEEKSGCKCVHGVVELNSSVSSKQLSAIMGPFFFYPNTAAFGKMRILDYKQKDDSFEIHPDTTKYSNYSNALTTTLKTGMRSGLKILADFSTKLSNKLI